MSGSCQSGPKLLRLCSINVCMTTDISLLTGFHELFQILDLSMALHGLFLLLPLEVHLLSSLLNQRGHNPHKNSLLKIHTVNFHHLNNLNFQYFVFGLKSEQSPSENFLVADLQQIHCPSLFGFSKQGAKKGTNQLAEFGRGSNFTRASCKFND